MNKQLSTYEREMQDLTFRKEFKKGYKKWLISELILALMSNDHKSVRILAKECGLSSAVITLFLRKEKTAFLFL